MILHFVLSPGVLTAFKVAGDLATVAAQGIGACQKARKLIGMFRKKSIPDTANHEAPESLPILEQANELLSRASPIARAIALEKLVWRIAAEVPFTCGVLFAMYAAYSFANHSSSKEIDSVVTVIASLLGPYLAYFGGRSIMTSINILSYVPMAETSVDVGQKLRERVFLEQYAALQEAVNALTLSEVISKLDAVRKSLLLDDKRKLRKPVE